MLEANNISEGGKSCEKVIMDYGGYNYTGEPGWVKWPRGGPGGLGADYQRDIWNAFEVRYHQGRYVLDDLGG